MLLGVAFIAMAMRTGTDLTFGMTNSEMTVASKPMKKSYVNQPLPTMRFRESPLCIGR